MHTILIRIFCIIGLCFEEAHLIHLREYWKFKKWLNIPSTNTKTWVRFLIKHNEVVIRSDTHSHLFGILGLLNSMKDSPLFNGTSCRHSIPPHMLILRAVCKEPERITWNKWRKQLYPEIYHIKPERSLSMNLTFLDLKLSGALQCVSGAKHIMYEYVSILQYNGTARSVPQQCHLNRTSLETHTECEHDLLCGHYPNHFRFLLYPTVILEILYQPHLTSKLTMLFQVISSDFATHFNLSCFWIRCSYSSPLGIFTEDILSLNLARLVNHVLYSFRVVTSRVSSLIIYQMSQLPDVIFDGPFFESEVLRGRLESSIGVKFRTTSFQATLLTFLNYSNAIHHMNRIYQYDSQEAHAETLSHLQNLSGEQKHFVFPWSSCNGVHIQLCTLRIPNPILMGVNITIASIEYKGPSILADSCSFGGFTIYFNHSKKENLQEIFNECHDLVFNSTEELAMHIFSDHKTEEIWISTVSYAQYSTISAEVTISEAPCKGVHMIPNVRKHCQYPGNAIIRKPITHYSDWDCSHLIDVHDHLLSIHFMYTVVELNRYLYALLRSVNVYILSTLKPYDDPQ